MTTPVMTYHAPVSGAAGILVVNSNAAVRRMLESHLQRRGHRVTGCGTVDEAKAILTNGGWALLIIEADLPDSSGYDLLRHARQLPDGDDMGIIITSDRDQPDRIMRALERGADDYLTSPISPAVAMARASALLSLRGATDRRRDGAQALDLPRLDRVLREALGGAAKLRAICDALRDGLEAERASVYRYDREQDELLTVVAHGEQAQAGDPLIRMSAQDGLAGACLRLGHLVNTPDAYNDDRFNQRFDDETGFKTRSVLSLPLRDEHNELIGVAQVLNHQHGPFTAHEEIKARQLAPRCALTLAEAFFEVDQKLNLAATIVAQPGSATFMPTMVGGSGFSTGILPSIHAKKAEDFVGTEIGRYRVTSVLGRGSQAYVLEGQDELLDRRVAIKLLGPDSARIPMLRRQFMQEARSMAKLGHPNTVAIHDVGDLDGALYLVMECCPHGTAWDLLRREGKLLVPRVARILRDACCGLDAAHRRGMIHRDIKPDNILLDDDGTAKLSDFGLVLAPNMSDLAGRDHVVGTPHYMSPEQCNGGLVDHRSDLYAMGATCYHLLTGHAPFHGSQDIREVMRRHCEVAVPDPRGVVPELPEDVVSIIAAAMAKKPEDRYQAAVEMLRDFEAILASEHSAG
jgi:DNA-binding response OmpR family regulator/tRNA A-37 threonylcarbamoyl transferase component Bud32